MAKNQLNLVYALKDGAIVNIAEVDSGLKCNCICPACGERLIAKKGSKKVHHFAHHSGTNCEYGYETSLHLAAKSILMNAKKMTLPAVYVHFKNAGRSKALVSEPREITIDHVELEKRYDDIVPDVVVYSEGKFFFVEIFVTHSIDDLKLNKLKREDISTIEIDLSKEERMVSSEELANVLINDNGKKTWKYNSVANKFLNRFCQIAEKKEIVIRGFAHQVDECPIKMRTWHGKPYANFTDDCYACKYCISVLDSGYILCSGKARIASVEDFSISEEERLRKSEEEISRAKDRTLAQGRCPNCGGQLVQRESRFGTFLGCNNYPHCRFTASIDAETGELITKNSYKE